MAVRIKMDDAETFDKYEIEEWHLCEGCKFECSNFFEIPCKDCWAIEDETHHLKPTKFIKKEG